VATRIKFLRGKSSSSWCSLQPKFLTKKAWQHGSSNSYEKTVSS
jgi:hypothetical protein